MGWKRQLGTTLAVLVLGAAGRAWAANPTLQYTNELSYDITHDQNITWTPTGGVNDNIDLKIFVPTPVTAGWLEQGGPAAENLTETPGAGIGITHIQDNVDVEYLHYGINYGTKQTTKLHYTYTIALRNTTLSGGTFDDLTATLTQSTGEGGYANQRLSTATLESAHADIVQLKDDILSNAGIDPASGLSKNAVKAFYDWIHAHLTYDHPYATGYEGTGKLTKYAGPFYNGSYTGQCGDYAAILVALSRAAGIPARVVTGHLVGGAANAYHCWAEIHFTGVDGWVPADPQGDQGPPSGYSNLGQLGSGNQRLVMCKGGDLSLNPGGHAAPLLQNNLWTWQAGAGHSHTPSVSSVVSSTLATNTRTITASASGEGSISPPGNVLVVLNADQPFTYAPSNANYKLDDLLVDGASVGTPANYTFTNLITDHTIHAVFIIDAAAYDGDGDGNPDAGQNDVQSFATQGAAGMMTTVWAETGEVLSNFSHTAQLGDAPSTVHFPYGFVAFDAAAANGATCDLSIYVPYDANITGYWKKSQTTGGYANIAASVSEIAGPPHQTRLQLSIAEGGPYDDDLVPNNGSLTDPGGPGYILTGGSYAGGSGGDANRLTGTMIPFGGNLLAVLLAGGCGWCTLRRRRRTAFPGVSSRE